MEGVSKRFGAAQDAARRVVRGLRRPGDGADRRKRRGEEHADEDTQRRDLRRSRSDEDGRASVRTAGALGCSPGRRGDDLPGAEPGPGPECGRQHHGRAGGESAGSPPPVRSKASSPLLGPSISSGTGAPPSTPVHSHSVGARQLVEIARALVMDARLIHVFDEPTSSLTQRDGADPVPSHPQAAGRRHRRRLHQPLPRGSVRNAATGTPCSATPPSPAAGPCATFPRRRSSP